MGVCVCMCGALCMSAGPFCVHVRLCGLGGRGGVGVLVLMCVVYYACPLGLLCVHVCVYMIIMIVAVAAWVCASGRV